MGVATLKKPITSFFSLSTKNINKILFLNKNVEITSLQFDVFIIDEFINLNPKNSNSSLSFNTLLFIILGACLLLFGILIFVALIMKFKSKPSTDEEVSLFAQT